MLAGFQINRTGPNSLGWGSLAKSLAVSAVIGAASLMPAAARAVPVDALMLTVGDAACSADSTGPHVGESRYQVDGYDVTVAQYRAFLDTTAAHDHRESLATSKSLAGRSCSPLLHVSDSTATRANATAWQCLRGPVLQPPTGFFSQPLDDVLTAVEAVSNREIFYGTFDQSGLLPESNDLAGLARTSRGL